MLKGLTSLNDALDAGAVEEEEILYKGKSSYKNVSCLEINLLSLYIVGDKKIIHLLRVCHRCHCKFHIHMNIYIYQIIYLLQ